jgi:hypothetical protein
VSAHAYVRYSTVNRAVIGTKLYLVFLYLFGVVMSAEIKNGKGVLSAVSVIVNDGKCSTNPLR